MHIFIEEIDRKGGAGEVVAGGWRGRCDMEDEDGDSLFEGMILFNPSQFHESLSPPLFNAPHLSPSQNLFSDLTLTDSEEVSLARLQTLREETAAALAESRSQCTIAADSRREALRRRRKAAEDHALASAEHRALESKLQDACEEEDFDSAQRISDSLVESENRKVSLLQRVGEAEAYSDSTELHMGNSLLALVAAEQRSASLFHRFAQQAEADAESLENTSESQFSKENQEWFASAEALTAGRIAVEIESQIIEDARTILSKSIEEATESDLQEKGSLSRKKETLVSELEELKELVRRKEEEIEETSLKIDRIDAIMVEVANESREIRENIETRLNDLQTALVEINSQTETLSETGTSIEENRGNIRTRAMKLKDLVRESREEARSYDELANLRSSLIDLISNSNERRAKIAEEEKKLMEEVNKIHLKLSSTRASLQDLSSRKSTIQKKSWSYNQRVFFIEKRIPELEAEKRVAATARNFAEAARMTSEARLLGSEKESLMEELRKEKEELEKVEERVESAASEILELEGILKGMEKEIGVARYRILKSTAERMDGGDEKEAADAEMRDLCGKYGIDEDTEGQFSVPGVSLEDVAGFGRDQLSRFAQCFPAS